MSSIIGGIKCESCKFFAYTTEPSGMGQCHRYPMPTESLVLGVQKSGEPIVSKLITPQMTPPTYWCGEYVIKIALQ